jgi:RND family efflux transporter MFP subunit
MKYKIFLFSIPVLIFHFFLSGCGQGEESGATESNLQKEKENDRGIPVEALLVKSQNVIQDLSITGILKPKHTVEIVAEVSGKVKTINKKLGDAVTVKDIMAVIDDKIPLSNYKQAKSGVLSAENNVKIAQLNLTSDEELYKAGDISKLEYESSLLAVKTAEANHLSALATLSLMEKTYNDTRISSPINGYVSRKYIDLGTMVSLNVPIYRVVDFSSLKIDIGVPQEMITHIQTGKKADIEISALGNEIFSGVVRYISPQADENTGAFVVEIHVKNTDDYQILAGMTARVTLILNSKLDEIVVPDNSIISMNDSNFVYIISGKKATLRHVIIGDSFDNLIAIEKGVSIGDTVVTVGIKNLKDKSPVIIESLH